jgi:hypothetical protein
MLKKYILMSKAEENKDGKLKILGHHFCGLETYLYLLENIETKYEFKKVFYNDGWIFYKKKTGNYILIIDTNDIWAYDKTTHEMRIIKKVA